MFRKFLDAVTSKKEPVLPRQGKRLLREVEENGDSVFTIKGTGRPGFFVVFGLMFGGPTSLILLAIIFGTPNPENGPFATIVTGLFLTPFIVIGLGTFLTGVFLWFGKTRIQIGQNVVLVWRELFGKMFQQKEFSRADLNLSFDESHKSNDIPSYKLIFGDGGAKNKIGVGGSLKEEELLWLEREVKGVLGSEIEVHGGVLEAMTESGLDDIYETVLDPNYRSKNLRFTKTNSGWEGRMSSTILGGIGLMFFGSIFLVAGLMMGDVTRDSLLDLVPWIREAVADASSSGDSPPVWFAMIFGGAGLLVVLIGLFSLGYRVTLSKRHSRLHLERRWMIFVVNSLHDGSEFMELEVKQNGHVNDEPRYRLSGLLKGGKKVSLARYGSAEDVGQLYARVAEMMPREPR
ncbi:MAG: hypothetical protein QNL24_12770 [Akkermansiaceae bacterium]